MGDLNIYALVVALAFPLIGALVAALGWGVRALRLGPLWGAPALASVVWVGASNARIEVLLLDARFGLDATSIVFLVACVIVWSAAATYAGYTMGQSAHMQRFAICFFGAMAGNFLLIGALDMISFMSGFALMSYAAYGLVVHTMKVSAWRAGRVYLTMTIAAEFVLWAGAVLAWSLADTWEFAEVRQALATTEGVAPLACALIFAAFAVKAGLVPLHVWLPLAYPAAPTAGSVVLSAAMINAGALGWLRFLPLGVAELPGIGAATLSLGALGIFGAAFVGLTQTKPKPILAYSSISQMGYVALLAGISAYWPQVHPQVLVAIAIFVLHHSFAKGALFFSVDAARRFAPRTSSPKRILVGALVILPAIALSGAPLTSGALAKYALKTVAHLPEVLLPTLLLDIGLAAGAMATAALMARFLIVLHRTAPDPSSPDLSSPDLSSPDLSSPDPSPRSWPALLAWVSLGTGSIWTLFLASVSMPEAGVGGILTLSTIWAALWPLVAIGAITWWVLGTSYTWLHGTLGRVAPGDLLVPLSWLGERALRRLARQVAILAALWARTVARLSDRIDAIDLRARSLPSSRRESIDRWISGEWLTLVFAIGLALAIWMNV